MAFIKNPFKKNVDDMQDPNQMYGPEPGYPPPFPNQPYDFQPNQPPLPMPQMQQQFPGQLNPQAYLPNLPPQQNDMAAAIQTLNSKMDLIANKLDNIIVILNNLLQYYQFMFRRQ